jgi:hypothetical protein
MSAGGDSPRPAQALGATFELERFEWGAPDRLELAGTFAGLHDVPPDDAALVVRGGGLTHRLAVDPASVSGPPEDGRRWEATFAWREAPVPFDAAELSLGDRLVVELPQPGPQDVQPEGHLLQVRSPEAQDAGDGAHRVRSQAELVVAQQEIHDLRAAADRVRLELARAREDLEAERVAHAEDAERFRASLEMVQRSAQEAVTAERGAAQQREADAREARDAVAARDAALQQLRGELEETASLRAELEQRRGEVEGFRAALRNTHGAVEAARAEAEHLLSGLTSARDTLEAAN